MLVFNGVGLSGKKKEVREVFLTFPVSSAVAVAVVVAFCLSYLLHSMNFIPPFHYSTFSLSCCHLSSGK